MKNEERLLKVLMKLKERGKGCGNTKKRVEFLDRNTMAVKMVPTLEVNIYLPQLHK